MSLTDMLTERLSALSKTEFSYVETDDIAKAAEVGSNYQGIYMEASVIYFEIKNTAFLLKEHGRRKVAQIYAMFREVLAAIAERSGGFVSCYSPEAFLVIYPGKEDRFGEVIRSAMRIANAPGKTFKEQFALIEGLEFAMGIDHGHVMGTKNKSDYGIDQMTWFGSCIYKAKSISKECSRPYHIGISSMIFHNLDEDMLVKQKRILGIPKKVEIWNKVSYQYENTKKHLYQTNNKLELDDMQ